MKKDIAVDEIRSMSHKISERFGNDTKALMDHYREPEKKYDRRILKNLPEPKVSGSKR